MKTKQSVTNEEGSLKPNQNGECGSKLNQNTDQNNDSYNTFKIETQELNNKEKASTHCLTILHFNDVYNIEQRDQEPVGGAARFAHKLASYKHLKPLTVFSGDVLNPSMSKYSYLWPFSWFSSTTLSCIIVQSPHL
jgi:hypothetical protein